MNVLASKGQLRASFIRWSLLTVPAILLLGYLSAELSGDVAQNGWFNALEKPDIFPPPATFGIVWAVLWVMLGFALALVCAAWGAKGRILAIGLFIVQFLLSLTWTPVFFAMRDMSTALIVIVMVAILAAITTAAFWKVRALAGWLMVPYLAWILFATVLNYQFLSVNPDADAYGAPGDLQRMEL